MSRKAMEAAREALRAARGTIPRGGTTDCGGYKCRQSNCYACCGDSADDQPDIEAMVTSALALLDAALDAPADSERPFVKPHGHGCGCVECEGEPPAPAESDGEAHNPWAFEAGRRGSWRDRLDADGQPTCGPSRSKTGHGCHYCDGHLDAKRGAGQYECPWCIARFPTTPPAESAGEDDAVLDGLISDLADDLAEVSSDGQRERLLGAFRVLLADVLTSVRAARDAEWRDGQVFSSAKPESPGCGSCDDGQVMVDGWWQPCAKCAPKPGEEA